MTKTIEQPGIEVPPGLLVPEIENDLTRRDFLIGAGLLALASGCGGGEEAANGGEETSSQTRTIEHKYGATEISGTPERVVATSNGDGDLMLALGLTPITIRAYSDEITVGPWMEEALGDAQPEVLPAFEELNFEQIAALRPDLILGTTYLSQEEYETLSEIAPTIAQPDGYVNYGVPWQVQTRLTGRALGKRREAERIIAEVEARFEDARQAHPEFEGASGAVALPGDGVFYPYGPKDARSRFIASLGFEIPERIVELSEGDFYATISAEQLDLIDTDVLLWGASEEGQLETVEESRIYQQLDVAKEGRDIFITDAAVYQAFATNTVLSIPYALDNLVPRIAAAIDGDPETNE